MYNNNYLIIVNYHVLALVLVNFLFSNVAQTNELKEIQHASSLVNNTLISDEAENEDSSDDEYERSTEKAPDDIENIPISITDAFHIAVLAYEYAHYSCHIELLQECVKLLSCNLKSKTSIAQQFQYKQCQEEKQLLIASMKSSLRVQYLGKNELLPLSNTNPMIKCYCITMYTNEVIEFCNTFVDFFKDSAKLPCKNLNNRLYALFPSSFTWPYVILGGVQAIMKTSEHGNVSAVKIWIENYKREVDSIVTTIFKAHCIGVYYMNEFERDEYDESGLNEFTLVEPFDFEYYKKNLASKREFVKMMRLRCETKLQKAIIALLENEEAILLGLTEECDAEKQDTVLRAKNQDLQSAVLAAQSDYCIVRAFNRG